MCTCNFRCFCFFPICYLVAKKNWVSVCRMDLVQDHGEEGIHYLARLNLMHDRRLRHDRLGSLLVLLLPHSKLTRGELDHFVRQKHLDVVNQNLLECVLQSFFQGCWICAWNWENGVFEIATDSPLLWECWPVYLAWLHWNDTHKITLKGIAIV
jgi:hypothetical protein